MDWQHGNKGETSSDFCRRMGWGPGDKVMQCSGIERQEDRALRLFTHEWTIITLDHPIGQYGCDVGATRDGTYTNVVNMCIWGLHGPVPEFCLKRGDVTCWPWAQIEKAKH